MKAIIKNTGVNSPHHPNSTQIKAKATIIIIGELAIIANTYPIWNT